MLKKIIIMSALKKMRGS